MQVVCTAVHDATLAGGTSSMPGLAAKAMPSCHYRIMFQEVQLGWDTHSAGGNTYVAIAAHAVALWQPSIQISRLAP